METAGKQVPRGIYALERCDYAELRCDKCTSTTQLKRPPHNDEKVEILSARPGCRMMTAMG